jgi:membrane protease YdiL (CAAX protease family)
VLAAIITAAAFGVMHGYHFIMLTPVISLGVMFALMREWRGSLIGPIFAHMLHNGTLVALLIVIFSIIG